MEGDFESGRKLRNQERKTYEYDQEDEIEGKRTFSVEEKLQSSKFEHETLQQMLGSDFNLKYIQEKGFTDPVVFKSTEGLDIRVPSKEFNVHDVKQLVGARRIVDVIDVNTQQASEMTMMQWARYFSCPESRDKVFNVISLEFSHTKLEELVECPKLVRQMDWVDLAWPKSLIQEQRETTNALAAMKYPKVRKYILMSVKGCFTDFHIDFGGTSVWYHILRGKKVFWLIRPTEENLDQYERWVLSGKQQDLFFGDQVETCSRVSLSEGDTLLIPTGWIHAVYTPEDSIVFGGNFLHSYDIKKQMIVSDIEDRTHVPYKFRYPFYTEITWYVLEKYVKVLERDILEREKQSRTAHVQTNKDGNPGNKSDESKAQEEQDVEMRDLSENASTAHQDSVKSTVKHAQDNWVPVHLTQAELEGLQCMVKKLSSWRDANKSVPSSILYPDKLLKRMEELLQLHESDEPTLAATGIQPLHLLAEVTVEESKKVKTERSPRGSGPSRPIRPSSSKIGPGVRRRRTRCRACEACLRDDCGKCRSCKDMRKFGGLGKMKQGCLARICTNPTLPSSSACTICEGGKGDPDLMECSRCGEIVHPKCLAVSGTYRIVEEINNCWECPKCCENKDVNAPSETVETKKRKATTIPVKVPPRKKIPEVKERTVSSGDDDEDDDAPLIKQCASKTPQSASRPHRKITLPLSHNGTHSPHQVPPRNVIRPAPPSPPPEFLPLEGDVNHALTRDIWMKIFNFMNQKELCLCMRVCRTWNRWAINRRYWYSIDLSYRKSLDTSALSGIVRRQPLGLNLSWTNVSFKQLNWLLNRLPRLMDLSLCGSTPATVDALCQDSCWALQSLDLSWTDGLNDFILQQLVASPDDTARSRTPEEITSKGRLRLCNELNLTGCDITDDGLSILSHDLSSLRKLNVSYCTLITDEGIKALTSGVKCGLRELTLTGCTLLTDRCLTYLSKCDTIQKLDLRKCPEVLPKACEEFASSSGRTLRVTEGCLISVY